MNSALAISLQRKLDGYRKVQSIHIDIRSDLSYDLKAVLEQEETGNVIRVELRDVSNVRLDSAGGGLMRFRFLKIEDLSDRQWDRTRFHVAELEDSEFECDCAWITIEN